MRNQLQALAPVLDRQNKLTALEGNITTLLATDVAWKQMVDRITTNLPAGISFTSFSASSTPPAPVVEVAPVPAATTEDGAAQESETTDTTTPTTVAPPAPTISGALTFQGTAPDYPTLARWIDAMGKVPEIDDIYVSTAQEVAAGTDGATSGITFTATAIPTQKAASDRLGNYVEAKK